MNEFLFQSLNSPTGSSLMHEPLIGLSQRGRRPLPGVPSLSSFSSYAVSSFLSSCLLLYASSTSTDSAFLFTCSSSSPSSPPLTDPDSLICCRNLGSYQQRKKQGCRSSAPSRVTMCWHCCAVVDLIFSPEISTITFEKMYWILGLFLKYWRL